MRFSGETLFPAALGLSLLAHAALVVVNLGPPVDRAVFAMPERGKASIRLRPLTKQIPEALAKPIQAELPPLMQRPRDRQLPSPVKRQIAELPLPKRELLPPPTRTLPQAIEPPEQREEPPPPEAKPIQEPLEREPPREQALVSDVKVDIESMAASASGGAEHDEPARVSQNPAPPYPPEALVRRWSGSVVLHVDVGPDGRPTAVSVAESTGHAVLDQTAADWVRRNWRWEPARKNGSGVPYQTAYRINFRPDAP